MLRTRVLAALVFAPALLWAVWHGGDVLAWVSLGLAALALWEYLALTLGAGRVVEKVLGYVLAAPVALWVLGWLPPDLGALVIPLGTMLVLTLVMLRPEPIEGSTGRAGFLVLGALYGGGLMPYLWRLREGHGELGLGIALMALFCTWASDTGAYFAGKALGRHKLYPKISPGKTVEGLVGGVVAAVGVAFLIAHLFAVPLPAWVVGLCGALAGLLGTAGDLCESMLKRAVGAKDSGKLIPGHGGVLDRFDAVMFVAPGIHVLVTLLR